MLNKVQYSKIVVLIIVNDEEEGLWVGDEVSVQNMNGTNGKTIVGGIEQFGKNT